MHQVADFNVQNDWTEELTRRIEALCSVLGAYLPAEHVEAIRGACYFAAEAHTGQRRRSGEPYIFHPIAVANILADLRFDHETIMAAILHDVIEDTKYSKEQLGGHFGPEVAELVDGVSKLTQIKFGSRLEAQAENFRKMFLAMSKDIRVIIVKLADRLHNMRTLGVMPPAKRRRIARETLEIYAPIAGRLGMNGMRQDLEDLGFSNLYPIRYRVLQEALAKKSGNSKEITNQLETRIRERLAELGLNAGVMGQNKHLWGIYKRMRDNRLSFREVQNVYALRIIADAVDTCYRILGVLHNLYKPIMGRFKDYIAIPKANGYQSLHTALFVSHEMPIEVQIQTQEMQLMAEVGIAAHWRYEAPDGQGNSARNRAREWLQKLLDMQRRAGDSVEFLESVKADLFPAEIYVFTPRGEIIEMPQRATAVDFAYAIHSDVGNTCVGAKVDGRLVPLRTPLTNGQTVEVIIVPTARPNPAWLSFVVTAKARSSIRHYLKHLQRGEAVILGKRLLEKALMGRTAGLSDIPIERASALVNEFQVRSFDDILADIGLGKRLAALIAKRLLPEGDDRESISAVESGVSKPLLIKGTEGTVVTLGRCCRPLPGDPIMGYLSTGRGIVIHRDSCQHVATYKKNPDKWLEVEWEKDIAADFPAELRLDVMNKSGVLATVAAVIAEAHANIETVHTANLDGANTTVHLILNVHGRTHLARIMRQLRLLPEVLRLSRQT